MQSKTKGSPMNTVDGTDAYDGAPPDDSPAESPVQALRHDFKRLSVLFQQIPQVSIQVLNPKGCVMQWNQTAAHFYGYDLAASTGKPLSNLLFPSGVPEEFQQSFSRALRTGEKSALHQWLVTTVKGEHRWVTASFIPYTEKGRITGMFCIQMDATKSRQAEEILLRFSHELEIRIQQRTKELTWVTQQLQGEIDQKRRAQEALKQSEENFRLFAQHSHNWEYWIAPDGSLVYVSPSCERISGYPPSAFTEEPALLRRIVHPLDNMTGDAMAEAHLNPEGLLTFEFRILTRNGDVRWLGHTSAPVIGENGGYIGRRVNNRDITRRRMAQEELERIHAQLEERVAERTRALEDTTAALRRKQQKLIDSQASLGTLNRELLETNKAVSVLARTMEKKKEAAIAHIGMTVTSKILPLISNLRKEKLLVRHRAEFDVLCAYLNDIAGNLGESGRILHCLSATEMRVASMIRKGLKTNEIAGALNISPLTVKTHRKNIRKKLNLSNEQVNLASYLRANLTE